MFSRAALRSAGTRTFLVVWFGELISTVGSGLTTFALSIWIYQRTNSVSLLALNMLAYAVPEIILAPLAGLVADRYNRRLVMIMGDLGAGITSLTVFLLFITGRLTIPLVIILSFLSAASSSFQWPAYSAVVPQLVPKDQLGRAGGMVQIGEAISYLIGPALAGALFVLPTFGFRGILFLDFATLGAAILTLMVVRIPDALPSAETQEACETPAGKVSFWKEVTYGWTYIRARKGLVALLIYFAIANFLQEFSSPLVQPLLLNITSADGVGIALSIMGAGMMVGVGIMTVWGGPKRRIDGILIPGLLGGLAIAVAGLRPWLPLITAAGFSYFLLWPILEASNEALWQCKIPTDVLGRVSAMRGMVVSSIRPLALIFAGPLADGVFEPLLRRGGLLAPTIGQIVGVGPGRGVALFLIVIGGLTALSALGALMTRSIRQLEDDIPDVIPDAPEPMLSGALVTTADR